jgi:hypothetical protein
MAFILCKDFDEENPRDFPFIDTRYNEYRDYLESISHKLPPSAKEFALADWRLNPTFHECPHDSWVEFVKINEISSGERRQNRHINIDVRLLGAYHDGYLDLSYKNVAQYELKKSDSWDSHGDWLYDEVRLSESGLVLHEIEFRNQTVWLIECEDIEFNWKPFEK